MALIIDLKRGCKLFIKWILFVGFSLFLISGCATTNTGRGFDLVDDFKYAQAIPFLEQGVEEGSKTAAIMLAFIYLSEFQVPVDINKAKGYYETFLALESNYYDQYLDYYLPQVKARILLKDEDRSNDQEATRILRRKNYANFSSSLSLLARCYSFGIGVQKNNYIAHQLYARAMDNERYQASRLHYMWWLSVHPDPQFRHKHNALYLMESSDEFDDEVMAIVYDTYAAVYAVNGQFDKAIEFQKKALSSLEKDMGTYPAYGEWFEGFQARLVSYNQQQAWITD